MAVRNSNIEKLDKQMQEFLRSCYSEIAKKSLPVFKKAYENRIAQWYRVTAQSTNYNSILRATTYRTRVYSNPTVTRKNSKDRIKITALVDENTYANIHCRSIDRWSARHSALGDRKRLYDGRDVLDLQMNQGILGLPARGETLLSNGTYWINHHFHQNKQSLREFLGSCTHSGAANTMTNIESDIRKDIEKIIKDTFERKGITLRLS